jgi:hypothetical protein
MCEDFAPNFCEMAAASRQRTVSHFLFHQGIFDGKQHNQLRTKLKGRHFDTTWVIEAESQAVLNTLTQHDLQNAFKNW